jgi:hypothetical protein
MVGPIASASPTPTRVANTRRTHHPVSRQDRAALATWAADCAEHVLHCFEASYPDDDRPRRAIAACREWVRTGAFRMADVRRDSLSAHAAARDAGNASAARFAARAAGHAVATAHVSSHAVGSAWNGVKAADVAGIPDEREWQYHRLPEHLRHHVLRLSHARPALARVLRYPTDAER